MDIGTLEHFIDAVGILACFAYLAWKLLPNDFLMPKDDDDGK